MKFRRRSRSSVQHTNDIIHNRKMFAVWWEDWKCKKATRRINNGWTMAPAWELYYSLNSKKYKWDVPFFGIQTSTVDIVKSLIHLHPPLHYFFLYRIVLKCINSNYIVSIKNWFNQGVLIAIIRWTTTWIKICCRIKRMPTTIFRVGLKEEKNKAWAEQINWWKT